MDTKAIEFLSLSIQEEAKAICSYKERAEHTSDETTKNLFLEIVKDETQHIEELIKELSRVTQ